MPEDLAALFAEGAVVDYGPEVANLVGRNKILEMVSRFIRNLLSYQPSHLKLNDYFSE
jgi:hypothetical protein